MMKSALCLLALALLTVQSASPSAADPVTPPQTAELNDARAVVDALLPPAQRQEMVRTIMLQMVAQLQQVLPLPAGIDDPGLRKLTENAHARMVEASMPSVNAFLPKMAEAMAVAYTDEFETVELKEIRAFAETPAGRHYFSRSMSILGHPAVAEANQAYLRDLTPVIEAQQKVLIAEVTSYLEAHPDVAEKISAARNAR